VTTLGLDEAYFDSEHDRCYCPECYPQQNRDLIEGDGPTPYVIPRGWYGFGLAVPPRAKAQDIFHSWSASFHGVDNPVTLKSILDCGELMKAGDKLIDGTQLIGTKCAGRQDSVFYTSPTVRYAGLKFYARPQRFETAYKPSEAVAMAASMVLQCRQRPNSYQHQGETMGFERDWPGHLLRWCPHVELSQIEWKSDTNVAAIPYRLLVRVFDADADEEYRSPIDAQLDLVGVGGPRLRAEQPVLPVVPAGGDQASAVGLSRPVSPNGVGAGVVGPTEPVPELEPSFSGYSKDKLLATCLDREFVQKELRWAQQYGKSFITVFEEDRQRQAFFDYFKARAKYAGTEWEFLLDIDAVIYRRDRDEAKVMVERILSKATADRPAFSAALRTHYSSQGKARTDAT